MMLEVPSVLNMHLENVLWYGPPARAVVCYCLLPIVACERHVLCVRPGLLKAAVWESGDRAL